MELILGMQRCSHGRVCAVSTNKQAALDPGAVIEDGGDMGRPFFVAHEAPAEHQLALLTGVALHESLLQLAAMHIVLHAAEKVGQLPVRLQRHLEEHRACRRPQADVVLPKKKTWTTGSIKEKRVDGMRWPQHKGEGWRWREPSGDGRRKLHWTNN